MNYNRTMTIISIFGKNNTGKSSLFNILMREEKALTDKNSGTTRDIQKGYAKLGEIQFQIIDTPGIEVLFKNSDKIRIKVILNEIIKISDVILLVFDTNIGLTNIDKQFVKITKSHNKKIILIENKCDDHRQENWSYQNLIKVSTAHRYGVSKIYEKLKSEIGTIDTVSTTQNDGKQKTNLLILGKSNVGKSTLVNNIIKNEMILTGKEKGTTKDSLTIEHIYKENNILITDTAGVDRKNRSRNLIGKTIIKNSLMSINSSHVVILIIDSENALEKQDMVLAKKIIDKGKSIVIGLSKWDNIQPSKRKALIKSFNEYVKNKIPQIYNLIIVPFSAKEKRGLHILMDQILTLHNIWKKYISTSKLNKWLGLVTNSSSVTYIQEKKIKLKYITQVKVSPPTFMIFTAKLNNVQQNYKKYLLKRLQKDFCIYSIPIKIIFRAENNPFI